MKLCDVCGNEISVSSGQCQFCGAQQRRLKTRGTRSKESIRTVFLEAGLPSVPEGCRRLEAELFKARKDGVRLLRVIHGWGSGGSEGKLREGCRVYLNRKKAEGWVKLLLRGEDYSRNSSDGRQLMNRYPELLKYEREDSKNPGITIIVI